MIKTQHPYVDDLGHEHATLIKTYTTLKTKVLKQIETDIVYGNEVVDIYPCPYTYEEVDAPEEEEEAESGEE